VIVVVGTPSFRPPVTSGDGAAGGLAVAVARTAIAAGASVQLVGKIGDDPAGDAVMLSLGRDRIGHAALLRDPAHPTPTALLTEDYEAAVDLDAPDGIADAFDDDDDDGGLNPRHPRERILPADPALRPALEAADVELGLRYVGDFSVLVLAEPLDADARRAAFEAAAYGQAHVIEIESAVGRFLLDRLREDGREVRVKLNDPELTCRIEIPPGPALIYARKIPGPGGLPDARAPVDDRAVIFARPGLGRSEVDPGAKNDIFQKGIAPGLDQDAARRRDRI